MRPATDPPTAPPTAAAPFPAIFPAPLAFCPSAPAPPACIIHEDTVGTQK